MEKIKRFVKPERNRKWAYGVCEATLYALAGFGVIDGEQALLLLTVPAALLGLARSNVRNPVE